MLDVVFGPGLHVVHAKVLSNIPPPEPIADKTQTHSHRVPGARVRNAMVAIFFANDGAQVL